MSSGDSRQVGSVRLMDATSSFASSMNNSSSSGSTCSASRATTASDITSVACIESTLAASASACASISARGILSVVAARDSTGFSCNSRCSTSPNTMRQVSALSSIYQGSARPACTVSM